MVSFLHRWFACWFLNMPFGSDLSSLPLLFNPISSLYPYSLILSLVGFFLSNLWFPPYPLSPFFLSLYCQGQIIYVTKIRAQHTVGSKVLACLWVSLKMKVNRLCEPAWALLWVFGLYKIFNFFCPSPQWWTASNRSIMKIDRFGCDFIFGSYHKSWILYDEVSMYYKKKWLLTKQISCMGLVLVPWVLSFFLTGASSNTFKEWSIQFNSFFPLAFASWKKTLRSIPGP